MLDVRDISVGYHRRGYRALCEGYLRALLEGGCDNLSYFNAKTVRRKTEACHRPASARGGHSKARDGISISSRSDSSSRGGISKEYECEQGLVSGKGWHQQGVAFARDMVSARDVVSAMDGISK
jgi:hypothetical protein